MNPNVRNTISKLGPTTFLTPEMLEAAAVAAENWPTRRANCDRRFINKYSLINSDDLSCTSTWYLPGQGGGPALEALMAVRQDNKLRDWLEGHDATGISGVDHETFNEAHRILEELSFISNDYVNNIEYQAGADKIAQQFRDAIVALPYLTRDDA